MLQMIPRRVPIYSQICSFIHHASVPVINIEARMAQQISTRTISISPSDFLLYFEDQVHDKCKHVEPSFYDHAFQLNFKRQMRHIREGNYRINKKKEKRDQNMK